MKSKRTMMYTGVFGLLLFMIALLVELSGGPRGVNAQEPQTAKKTVAETNSQAIELFKLVDTQRSQSTASIAAVLEQEIEINLEKVNLETVQKLRFPLLNGKTYEATRRNSEGFVRFASDEYSWRGKMFADNDWNGDVILTVKGMALSGLIYSPGAVYEIVPQENFKHLLVQIDQSQFPPCGGAIPANPQPESTGENTKALPAAQIAFDDGSQIDVMIVYTASVRSALGGTTQTQAFAQQAVSTTNTVYQNSGIATRLRLVQTMEVSYPDNGTGRQGLDWVTADSTVAAARNTAKADMVALLTENAIDVCGIAWIMANVGPSFESSAFSLTQRGCAIGGLTFPHELGHNQACDHNPENANPPSQLAYPYAFGHWNSGANFRTVMSYPNPCPSCDRIPYFSNPSITHNGMPIGIANQRDNSRVINNTALTISQFRDSGGGGCTYSLSPTSRNFSAASNSSFVNVTTASNCPWTATVNASSDSEVSPGSDPAVLFSLPILVSQLGLANSPPPPGDVFLNATPIMINDRSSNSNPPATGSLYPSTINVAGMTGTITLVQAALNGVSHTFPDDIDVVLVGPSGQRVILMSDVGGNADLAGVDLIFEQTAGAMPDSTQVVSGTYRPTNFTSNATLEPGGIDIFPSPGPGQSVYAADLSVFNGTSPNGTWRLYVVDDESADGGSIANGWALGIITSGGGTTWINITSGSTGTGNGTVNYSVAANSGTSQRTGTITVNGQVHTVTQAGAGGGCPATSINMGQTLNGSLAVSDCVLSGTSRHVDVYSFSGVAGQGIAASMDASGFDTYLYLTNSANQILDEDNNSGPGTNSRIPGSSSFFTLPASGSYFLWASSATDNATGSYSVGLSQCAYSISSSENTVGPGNGGGSFHIDTSSGCTWSAVSDSTSWLTTSSSGSGDGTVSYNFTANPNTSPRTGRITVGGQVSTITQIGVGGAGNVRFSSATYSENEGGGEATITVTRSGGTETGTVNYSTSDGTATAGMDYTAVSGLLLFGPNETSKSFNVTILDDTAFEGNEAINLSLSNPSTSLTLGNPGTATLTIIDNESSPQPVWLSLGGWVHQPVVASHADGRLEVFIQGSDNVLYHRVQTAANSATWGPWLSLGGWIDQIAVGKNLDGRLEVFVRGRDGGIYHRSQVTANSANWNDFSALGVVIQNLAVASNADGRLEVFIIGADNGLYRNTQGSPNSAGWSGWVGLGGWIDKLAVERNGDGRLEVFARGSDQNLYHNAQVSAGSVGWTGWSFLGGGIDRLAVGRNADGRLQVFTRGADFGLSHRSQTAANASSWTGLTSLGGWIDNPVVVSGADGRLEVFVTGLDGGLYRNRQTVVNSANWSGWTSLGNWLDELAVGRNANGVLQVFGRGNDKALYHLLITP